MLGVAARSARLQILRCRSGDMIPPERLGNDGEGGPPSLAVA